MSTINGIGSTFVGCSDVGTDGSYVTTKWFSLLIPVVPLGSYRVLPVSSTSIPMLYSSTKFMSQSVPLHWPHVLKMYATYLVAFLFVQVSGRLIGPKFTHKVSSPLLSAILAFGFAFLTIGISGFIRRGSTFANLIVMAFVLTFSFLIAGNISGDPDRSLIYMYILWGAYAIFSLVKFLGGGNSADKPKEAERKPSRASPDRAPQQP